MWLWAVTSANLTLNHCSGKTTLLAKLQGNEDPKKGSGLEFGYIEVRDEEESEEHTLLNHFVLDGNVAHANLLRFALTEQNVESTTVLVRSSPQN